MKKIGFILDKNSKKVFILPDDVKQLTSKGIVVNLPKGYGNTVYIDESKYVIAGAKILANSKAVITNSDIVCKPQAFNKNELKLMSGKTAITMANYLANVEMLYLMLKNNIKSYAWSSLSQDGQYVFFADLEKIKGKHAAKKVIENFKNKKTQPRAMVLNATWASYEAITYLLAHKANVTLFDNDSKYCRELKKDQEIIKLSKQNNVGLDFKDAKFDTLLKAFPTHNAFINTCIDPFNRTKIRITEEMAKSMAPESILVDESSENGYAFHFIKKFVSLEDKIEKIGKSNFSCVADITELYPKETSQIISTKSVDYLAMMANDQTEIFSDILITKDSKCVNKEINKQLKLF